MKISVVMPALNEEKNILSAIDNTLKAFDNYRIDGEIIVVNDGSADSTPDLVMGKIEKESRIRMFSHTRPEGIGASFWDGVKNAKGEAVVMLPGDNENEPAEILRYFKLLDEVDLVIPFVINREVRPLSRNLLSSLYRFIINTSFGVSFHYTNGTVIYRRSILDDLELKSSGFFFQTEILVKMAKRGHLFAEVPYRLGSRRSGTSKALTLSSLVRLTKNYLQLLKNVYLPNVR